MVKKWIFPLLIGVCLINTSMAQENPILLFPKGAPGETIKLIEKADTDGGKTGGESVLRITNVSEPTITIYHAPDEVASGAAMIVCPGGGYNILAYDLEGDEVCEWLNNLGITAVLLKYRVPRREGLENIDPKRIGVMGFSAGGHLAAMVSNNFLKRTYPAIDATDKVSCRPDYCLLVYPAYLDGENFQLAPELKVSSATPPTMLIQAEDDKSYINSSIFYYYALKEAGVPAWMHLYSQGGHGYGLRDTGASVNEWPDRAEDWFREIGLIE